MPVTVEIELDIEDVDNLKPLAHVPAKDEVVRQQVYDRILVVSHHRCVALRYNIASGRSRNKDDFLDVIERIRVTGAVQRHHLVTDNDSLATLALADNFRDLGKRIIHVEFAVIDHRVPAVAAVDRIIAGVPENEIVAGIAIDRVVTVAARENGSVVAAMNDIITIAAVDYVGAATTEDFISACGRR